MALSELIHLGITEALQEMRARRLSPIELTRAYLERIEKLNPALNVYLTILTESALAAAKPAIPRGEIDASVPTAIITSASPRSMTLAASPIECVPVAHAVTVQLFGPFAPRYMET